MSFDFLKRLKAQNKIALVVGVLLLPLAIMTMFFHSSTLQTISFSERENDGIDYLEGAWHTARSLIAASTDSSVSPFALAKDGPDLTKLSKEHDPLFSTGDASKALVTSLEALGWPNRNIGQGDAAELAIANARGLIGKIADGSGLTLDPEIDSYYVMDVVTIKLPEAIDRARAALINARGQQKRQDVSEDEKAALMIQLALFKNAVDGVAADLTAAYAGNANGETRENLVGPAASFSAAAAQFAKEMANAARTLRIPAQNATADLSTSTAAFNQLIETTEAFWKAGSKELSRLLQARIDENYAHRHLTFAVVALLAFIALALTYTIGQELGKSLVAQTKVIDELSRGNFATVVPGCERGDEVGQIARGLEQYRLEGIKYAKEAQDNQRIRVALENASTNVLVADNSGLILFVNKAMLSLMRAAQADFRAEYPRFDPETIVGTNVDVFHGTNNRQSFILQGLTTTHHVTLNIGSRIFEMAATPVIDQSGQRVGTVVEWTDVTTERAVQAEVDAVVTAAVDGNFRERLSLDGKKGFMRKLAEAMNRLCATTEEALGDVNATMAAMANGDLTGRITKSYSGMLDELKQNVNNASERLANTVTGVIAGSEEVANAASEISSGTNDLSARTEQQASNLQETAASMEEMASTIKQNADNASQANQLAIRARSVAVDGGTVVHKAVDAMSRIDNSSQKISDIIGVIDEIAFQTNLLAINAAVEAARAGDAGRGFAVVASEVRQLAQRSSEAAKDIKELIVESSTHVKDGVKLVNDAGLKLSEIVDSVKRVTDIVSEIAAASREQSTGVEEINRAVTQMDEMTQQNSALVEESAASSRTLQEQAQMLRKRMSFFKTSDGDPDLAEDGAHPVVSMHRPAERTQARKPAQRMVKLVAAGGAVKKMQSELQHAFTEGD